MSPSTCPTSLTCTGSVAQRFVSRVTTISSTLVFEEFAKLSVARLIAKCSRVPDFQRAIPLLPNPVDLWHTGGTKSRSELGDAVRIRKVTPEMDAIDHVRGQRVTLDERHREAVIEARTDSSVFDGHCSRQPDLVHVEPVRPFHVADAQGEGGVRMPQ